MFNKILIGVGVLFGSTLIVSNMIGGVTGNLFWIGGTPLSTILILAMLLGAAIGIGVVGILNEPRGGDEDTDF